jgi:uncharacterized membrane protein
MINLYKSQTNKIIVTGLENTSLPFTLFYFKFVNRVTKDVVELWLTNESTKSRWQYFTIVVNTYFANAETGMWTYTMYGAITPNVPPNSSLLETGIMYLYPATEFAPIEYNQQSNQFITYNG